MKKPSIATVLDVLGFAGLGLVGYGVWQIYVPAAYITVGAVLLIVALLGARK